jgi:hypothetical protein
MLVVNCISDIAPPITGPPSTETMLVNGQESAGNVQKSILEERNEKWQTIGC